MGRIPRILGVHTLHERHASTGSRPRGRAVGCVVRSDGGESKEGWQLEQCKQWGCIGIHKNASVKFTSINHARYEFKTKQFAPIIWLIKVSKLEKYKNITFILKSECEEKEGFIHIKEGIIVCFKELETEFRFCFCENE